MDAFHTPECCIILAPGTSYVTVHPGVLHSMYELRHTCWRADALVADSDNCDTVTASGASQYAPCTSTSSTWTSRRGPAENRRQFCDENERMVPARTGTPLGTSMYAYRCARTSDTTCTSSSPGYGVTEPWELSESWPPNTSVVKAVASGAPRGPPASSAATSVAPRSKNPVPAAAVHAVEADTVASTCNSNASGSNSDPLRSAMRPPDPDPCAGEVLAYPPRARSTASPVKNGATATMLPPEPPPAPLVPPAPLTSSSGVDDVLHMARDTEALMRMRPPPAPPVLNTSWLSTSGLAGMSRDGPPPDPNSRGQDTDPYGASARTGVAKSLLHPVDVAKQESDPKPPCEPPAPPMVTGQLDALGASGAPGPSPPRWPPPTADTVPVMVTLAPDTSMSPPLTAPSMCTNVPGACTSTVTSHWYPVHRTLDVDHIAYWLPPHAKSSSATRRRYDVDGDRSRQYRAVCGRDSGRRHRISRTFTGSALRGGVKVSGDENVGSSLACTRKYPTS